MTLSPKKINFIEFLTLISGLAEVEKKSILVNYDFEIKGTLQELKKFAEDIENLDFKRFVYELNEYVNTDISNIEIINYLGELTNEFETNRVKEVLNEMEMFECMILHETFNELAHHTYLDNKWEIPNYKVKNILNGKMSSIPNYKEMRNKVFPYGSISFYFALNVLKKSIQQKQQELNEKITKKVDSIQLTAVFAIEKSIKRITKRLAKNINSQKTVEDKILYCKNEIKLIKQQKNTFTPIELKNNNHIESLETPNIIIPNQTKILVDWLKTEIEYLKGLHIEGITMNIDPPQNNYAKTKEDLLNKQNQLIPKVPILDVYNHFNVLTEATNKHNEFYLTPEQLLIFIQSVFIDKKPIKQDFNCKGIIKKTVRNIFYKFYFSNKNKERNESMIKRKYFNIMNDAFKGFNENDYTDFAK